MQGQGQRPILIEMEAQNIEEERRAAERRAPKARRSRSRRIPSSDARTSSTRSGGSSAPYEGMTADEPSQPTRYSTVTDTLSVCW